MEHTDRMRAAQDALNGLSVGDALGDICAYRCATARERILDRALPPGPWWYTDDTELSLAVWEVLAAGQGIDEDLLAQTMARRYRDNPDRGYGKMTRITLRHIGDGADLVACLPHSGEVDPRVEMALAVLGEGGSQTTPIGERPQICLPIRISQGSPSEEEEGGQ